MLDLTRCAALIVWLFGVAFPFYGVINSATAAPPQFVSHLTALSVLARGAVALLLTSSHGRPGFMGSFAGSLTAFILPTVVYLW